MKINYIFCCLFSILISVSLSAQTKKIKYNSINSGGIAIGEISTYGVFQTINGVEYNKWCAGIGAGYDAYYYKSFPLFLDIRRYCDKQNKFFIYGDAGYNFPGKNTPGNEISYYSSYHFSGGLYNDAGLGYKMKFIMHTSILLVAGYSHKKIYDKVDAVYSCPFVGPCLQNSYNYNYGLGRIILKTGIMF